MNGPSQRPRSREEVARFFDGLDLIGPGLVSGPEWLAATSAADGVIQPADVSCGYSGVGRKP